MFPWNRVRQICTARSGVRCTVQQRRWFSSCTIRSASTRDRFELDPSFTGQFRNVPVKWGYGAVGELVYKRTYARRKPNGQQEEWWETVARVVTGTYNMQRHRIVNEMKAPWNLIKAQKSAQEMYRRIFEMKFLPPGRGLWIMGSPITEERKLYAALNNCAFVSTQDLAKDPTRPFEFLMDASMLGVGVGFDVKGADSFVILGPNKQKPVQTYVVDDTREGWVQVLVKTLESYFKGTAGWSFDVSKIRPAGSIIYGFGGVASGPQTLMDLVEAIKQILDPRIGKRISATDIVDIQNLIGRCVVAGNVRRTAEIVFGDATSEEYLNLKNYNVNPRRRAYGWTSNNSVFAEIGMDYNRIADLVKLNGEPGFGWLKNMQNYGRMNGTVDPRDYRVAGANPCNEQSLENFELCTLVEMFPSKHETLEDFLRTTKYAYLYAKTVTLGLTHWPESNQVMQRNRRIGCSVSGIVQSVHKLGLHKYAQWLEKGYDTIQEYDDLYSMWMAIPRSIKTTSVKPSGSVSLLAGVTPGVHWPTHHYYIRRIRIDKKSKSWLDALRRANYRIEDAVDAPNDTVVVEIPVHAHTELRTASKVSMWEKLSLAAFMQRHWADNQISATICFDRASEGQEIANALNYFQFQLKGVSFMPRDPGIPYPQMPYEAITKEEYEKRIATVKPLNFTDSKEDSVPERFCDSTSCAV